MTLRRLYGICSIFLLLSFLLNGCAFFKLEEELEEFEDTFWIGGKITNKSPHQKEVLVVMCKEVSGTNEIHKSRILDPSGEYTFEVKPGNYFLWAFEDRNGNLDHDPGEFVGHFGNPDRIEVRKENMPVDTPKLWMAFDFSIKDSTKVPAGFDSGIQISSTIVKGATIFKGDLIAFSDKKMSAEYGSMGYWQPLTFLREVGVGIYFLVPYDANKIPVLFVHGAVGTPSHFKEIANHIDRKRYQPWLYYYPSGMPLEKISNALNI